MIERNISFKWNIGHQDSDEWGLRKTKTPSFLFEILAIFFLSMINVTDATQNNRLRM